MRKVFIFSDLYLPTFPFLELPLYNYLKESGVDVKYVLQEGDIRMVLPHLKSVYTPITTVVRKPKHILTMMDKRDLLVCRFGYKDTIGSLISKARAVKRRVLALDPAAVDIAFRECQSQYLTIKSPWLKTRIPKKILRSYTSVHTVGTIHFDEAWRIGDINKHKFMESYGLNPNKKLVILCKSSAGEIGHQKGVDAEYKNIVNIVRQKCPDYELLFKCHPLDHLCEYNQMPGVMRKNVHYKNKPSWKILFPGGGVKVIKPEEGYKGFKCADAIINVRSSIGMESMLFPTPLINVNSHKYLVNWPKSKNEGVMKSIKLEELGHTLNNNKYRVDYDACKKHVLQFCDIGGDGKAYIRTGDIIIRLLG